MSDEETKIRLVNIEMALDNQNKTIEDLSDVVFKQGKLIDKLLKQVEMLRQSDAINIVKPLNEETPPPHY